MILEFKTKRNANGHRHYLRIDTDKKEYSNFCRKMTVEGIEIKANDMRDLGVMVRTSGYTINDEY